MSDELRELLDVPSRAISAALSAASQRGALTTIAPLLAVLFAWLWAGPRPDFIPTIPEWFTQYAGLIPALAVAVGAWLIGPRPRTGRLLATVGVLLFGFVTLPVALRDPQTTLALFLIVGAAVVWLGSREPVTSPKAARPLEEVRLVRSSSFAALTGWLVAVPGGVAESAFDVGCLGALLALWFMCVLPWWHRAWVEGQRRSHLLAALTAVGLVIGLTGAWLVGWKFAAAIAGLGPAAALVVARVRQPVLELDLRPWWSPLVEHPARLLVGTFFATAVVGGILLSLPVCTTRPEGIAALDAFFTSFSATCVTGLIVLDTPVDFNLLGQAVILVLIQIGGLGIMTFSTAAILLLGRRMSVRHEGAVAELIATGGRGDLFTALRRMIGVTAVTEGLGALTLLIFFLMEGDGLFAALWRAVFTAISAFCNAGFALQLASLEPFQSNPGVLLTVSALIVIGGLGPLAVVSVPRLWRGEKISLQVRMVYLVSAVLLLLPALLIALVEWRSALGGLEPLDRIVNAWFQSVTLRTAGFNSIDLTLLEPATLTMMFLLMFIGGSPGSTAGGIKTTTIMLLLLAVVAALRGRAQVTFLGWRIPHSSVYKAAAITTLGVASVVFALLILQLTQVIGFESIVFEAISALATVGLSLGATGELDGVGKVVIIMCMFMGRVGPLTLFLLLMGDGRGTRWDLPEQEISVG